MQDLQWMALLYARSAPVALAVAHRILRDGEEAEDVLQDAFISAAGARRGYDPRRGSELSWLLMMVRTIALDRLRARRVRSAAAQTIRDAGEAAFSPQLDPIARGHLNAALSRMPVQQRAALLLAYFEGFSHIEIAVRMGAPLGSVKTWLRMGLARLATTVHDPPSNAAGAAVQPHLG